MASQGLNRRTMLSLTACAGAGLLTLGHGSIGFAAGEGKKMKEEVSANEDLMREHGALVRLLLVSREAARRLKNDDATAAKVLREATEIIATFIGGYHERIEEMHVFPRFTGTGELPDLVRVLDAQHKAGRGVTKRLLELVKSGSNDGERKEAAGLVESFARMYYPHLAREDTVLFPAFRASMSEEEYRKTGEQFEDEEHEILGDNGYEKVVVSIAGLEKELGIYDLAQFTPKA